MIWRTWLAFRWVLKHGGEIRVAIWIVGGIIVMVLVALGVTYYQVEVRGYRFRIEPVQPPPILKGWDAKTKDGKGSLK